MGWLKKMRAFLNEVRAEMKKVTFPSRNEVITASIVVVVASFIFGVFLYAADFVIVQIYSGILGVFGA
jgi:preprotein translocase subunit SecE